MDFLQQLHTARAELEHVSVPPDSTRKLHDLSLTLDHLSDCVISYAESVLIGSASVKMAVFQLDERWWKTLDSVISYAKYFRNRHKLTEPFDQVIDNVNALKQWTIDQAFDDDPATDELIALLDAPNHHIRTEALMRLRDYPDTVISMIPELFEAYAHSKDGGYRSAISTTLVTIGEGAVPYLLSILESGEFDERRRCAINTLGFMGADALKAIIKAWPTANDDFRWVMTSLLYNYQEYPEPVMPLLLEAIQSSDTRIQFEALEALEYFRWFASDAVPVLEELLHSEQRAARRRLIRRVLKLIAEAGQESTS